MDLEAEWLEADGLGGFASGTAGLIRTRRYHALLLTAWATGRFALVNGMEVWAETPAGRFALSSQAYVPDVVFPDGRTRISAFTAEPWPCWHFTLPDGTTITQEIFVSRATAETVLRWRADHPLRILARLLMSGRDYHALHHENPVFDFTTRRSGDAFAWHPYPSVPATTARGNFTWADDPAWFRHFTYAIEVERGLDDGEDLASPGLFTFDRPDDAVLILRADTPGTAPVAELEAAERARRSRPERDIAADAYLTTRGATAPDFSHYPSSRERVGGRAAELLTSHSGRVSHPPRPPAPSHLLGKRNLEALPPAGEGEGTGSGLTVMAGYPWFTDWGRDTFIAVRGLLLARGRLDEAAAVLLAWAGHVSDGMLPNRFPDGNGPPEYNAADASLWFIVAVHELIEAGAPLPVASELQEAANAILEGYTSGTRFGIKSDARDGLLFAGVPGVQVTWMDAKIGDRVITPRIGKPVELQALWVNALAIAGRWPGGDRWVGPALRARDSVVALFPDRDTGGLIDVLDTDGVPGARDRKVRPNQVLAAGGLPIPVLTPRLVAGVVALAERALLTPLGLRTLAPDDPDYRGRYEGGPEARDSAYHQGTAWPWLLGPFVSAWLTAQGNTPEARAEGRKRFLPPLYAHLHTAGLGHVSEVVDGDAPHRPGGCPFQAWSFGELVRIEAMLGLKLGE